MKKETNEYENMDKEELVSEMLKEHRLQNTLYRFTPAPKPLSTFHDYIKYFDGSALMKCAKASGFDYGTMLIEVRRQIKVIHTNPEFKSVMAERETLTYGAPVVRKRRSRKENA